MEWGEELVANEKGKRYDKQHEDNNHISAKNTCSYNKQSVTAELKEQKQQFKNIQQQMIHGHI